MLRQSSLPIARMKKSLLLLLTALGLIALAPTSSKAQDFSFSFGGAPGFYPPGYYGDPGYGYYYRRVYYRPAYYYYGGYYHRRHHRCHHWHDQDDD
jgi:hypothetical protein